MNIEHIVFSGGGPVGFPQFTAMKHLVDSSYVDLSNIKSIYCTSAGCFNGIVFALKYDLEQIYKYLLERPWEKEFDIKPSSAIFNIFTNKGIYDIKFFEKIIHPVLLGANLDVNITLNEFYEHTKVDLHFFTSEFNTFKSIDVSYKDFPTLKLTDALHMSSGLPLIFTPYTDSNNYYVDGGLMNNFPLDACIKNNNIENTESILAFKNINDGNYINVLNSNSDMSEIVITLIRKITRLLAVPQNENVKYTINIYTKGINLESMTKMLQKENRLQLLDSGLEYARLFLVYHNLL